MVKSAVEAFIDTYGPAKVADAAKKSVAAVRVWRWRHVIPRSAWPDLIDGLEVTLDQLREVETLSAPFAAQRKAA